MIRPIWWLLIAELCFFFIAAANIIHGILFMIDPSSVSFVVLFCMFASWMLNDYVSYLFRKHTVTVDDLLGKPK